MTGIRKPLLRGAYWPFLGICLVLSLFAPPLLAEHTLELPEVGSLERIECLHYRFEKRPLPVKKILNKKFQEFCGTNPDFGLHSETLWLRFDIKNRSFLKKSFWFLLKNSRIAEVDVLLFDRQGQRLSAFFEGYRRVVSYKTIPMSFPAFWIAFPPNSTSIVLLRLKSKYPYELNFRLLSDADFHAFLWKRYFSWGFFYGLMALSFLALFLAYFFLHYNFLLWAAAIVALQSLFLAGYDGLWYYFRDTLGLPVEQLLLLGESALPLSNIFVNLLIASLAGLEYKKNPNLYVALHLSTALYAVLGIAMFFFYYYSLLASNLLSTYSTILLVIVILFFLRRGKSYLRLLLAVVLPNLIWIFIGIYKKYFPINLPSFPEMFHLQVLFAYFAFILAVLEYLRFHSKREKQRIEEGIRKQTAELRLATHRAEAANRFKEDLIRMVGHDLRSPLLALKTSLPFLDSTSPNRKPLSPSQKQIHRQSTQTIDGLLSYIDHILADTGSPIDDWKLDMQYHPLQTIKEEILQQNKLILSKKKIQLMCQLVPVQWFLDKEFFLRVIGNLIDNSVKFSKIQGRIWIEMPNETTLLIRDEGMGLPSQKLDLFHAGTRLPPTQGTLGEKGSGRGLAYAKLLIEIQGGTIRMENAPKGGLQICISWPKEQIRIP